MNTNRAMAKSLFTAEAQRSISSLRRLGVLGATAVNLSQSIELYIFITTLSNRRGRESCKSARGYDEQSRHLLHRVVNRSRARSLKA
jgi:hypothetical protein